jgi:hypothetical protein
MQLHLEFQGSDFHVLTHHFICDGGSSLLMRHHHFLLKYISICHTISI